VYVLRCFTNLIRRLVYRFRRLTFPQRLRSKVPLPCPAPCPRSDLCSWRAEEPGASRGSVRAMAGPGAAGQRGAARRPRQLGSGAARASRVPARKGELRADPAAPAGSWAGPRAPAAVVGFATATRALLNPMRSSRLRVSEATATVAVPLPSGLQRVVCALLPRRRGSKALAHSALESCCLVHSVVQRARAAAGGACKGN